MTIPDFKDDLDRLYVDIHVPQVHVCHAPWTDAFGIVECCPHSRVRDGKISKGAGHHSEGPYR